MTDIELLIDLYKGTRRQGPGSDRESLKALELADFDDSLTLNIADIACGTGASSLLLAKQLNAKITAVDLAPQFLQELAFRAESMGVRKKISTLQCSMDRLPFGNEALDLIRCEGGIYNMGFEKGINAWRQLLKPGAKLALSEITWFTAKRPDELQAQWEADYPKIASASQKLQLLEQHGYTPEAYFVLPSDCWTDHYYLPLKDAFSDFLDRHSHSPAAQAFVAETRNEITLYERYQDYFGYGFYIAKKLGSSSAA